ncbi:hypothetical protein FRB96_008126 [Tulasnella sp. 330]|nr:hypothetical protein FRB96_008126 [Tulasnella sp. 330]
MASKRKRRVSSPATTSEIEEIPKSVKRARPSVQSLLDTRWEWLDQEKATPPLSITNVNARDVYGFISREGNDICPLKREKIKRKPAKRVYGKQAAKEVIEINTTEEEEEEEDSGACNPKGCKKNPQCLNYLGQALWQDADAAKASFLKARNIGANPLDALRDPDLPVGLKNLGATCYMNAFLQVWFQDLRFRAGVYQCVPEVEDEKSLQESPVYQLQVTFAYLQNSSQNVFNPQALVDSLRLPATEQQDAQEFSKLLLHHLESVFAAQSVPSLKTLVADQFSGLLTYGTECHNCKTRSERESEFYELEINLKPNCTLERRISALLESEELTGDNKYYCQPCESLQDASRYTKLKKLPPVLHVSVLRFVFDMESMSRNKSKQSITFPSTLDMAPFLEDGTDGNATKMLDPFKENSSVYDLRGILLHKGASAYHGHYESQVYDMRAAEWFQFNDEEVTKVNLYKSAKNKKKRKLTSDDDSEDDLKPLGQSSKKGRGSEDAIPRVNSQDAYMLIYMRRDTATESATSIIAQNPPLDVQKEVESANNAHDELCEKHQEQLKVLEAEFAQIYADKMATIQSWNIRNHDEPSMVFDREVLEKWLSPTFLPGGPLATEGKVDEPSATQSLTDMPANSSEGVQAGEGVETTSSKDATEVPSPDSDITLFGTAPDSNGFSSISFDNKAIVCTHGRLDPKATNRMKRISLEGYAHIVKQSGLRLEPEITSDQVCLPCVSGLALERLRPSLHRRHVKEFEDGGPDDLDDTLYSGFWISKAWLKNWRSFKPKRIDSQSAGDVAPDDPTYVEDVVCGHYGLNCLLDRRILITEEQYRTLRRLFPEWDSFPYTAVECEQCMDSKGKQKEEDKSLKLAAEREKALLKTLLDHPPPTEVDGMAYKVTYALIPQRFFRGWKNWVQNPTKHRDGRPTKLDTSSMICVHGFSVMDVNDEHFTKHHVALIAMKDWKVFDGAYGAGPLVLVRKLEKNKTEQEPAVCRECWKNWSQNEAKFEVGIRHVYTVPSPSSPQSQSPQPMDTLKLSSSEANVLANSGTRRSKRLGKSKGQTAFMVKKVLVTGADTVEDINTNLTATYPRLYYNGHHLLEPTATMLQIGVQPGHLIELYDPDDTEPDPDDDFWLPVNDDSKKRRKGRVEGPAFDGTLLGGGLKKTISKAKAVESEADVEVEPEPSVAIVFPSQPDPDDVQMEEESADGLACKICTFLNPAGVSCCTMCDAAF